MVKATQCALPAPTARDACHVARRVNDDMPASCIPPSRTSNPHGRIPRRSSYRFPPSHPSPTLRRNYAPSAPLSHYGFYNLPTV